MIRRVSIKPMISSRLAVRSGCQPNTIGSSRRQCSRSRTRTPTRGLASRRPFAHSTFTASRSEVRLTPRLWVKSSSRGRTSPGLYRPPRIHAPIVRTTESWMRPPLAGRPSDAGSSLVNFAAGVSACPSAIALPLLLGDQNRGYQEYTAGHHLIKGGYAGQDHAVIEHSQDQHAKQPADDRSFAAGQRATAQHRSRDGLQLQPVGPRHRLSGTRARRQQHAGEARGRSAQNIDANLIGAVVQAGQSRDDRIAADRVDIASGQGISHQDEERGDDSQQNPDRNLHAEEASVANDAKVAVEDRNRLAIADNEGDAAKRRHCAEGGYHRINAADGDDQSVHKACDDADRNARRNAQRRRTGPGHDGRNANSRHADHRAHGNVEAAGNNDDRLRSGKHPKDGDRLTDVLDVAGEEENVWPQRAEDRDQNRQRNQEAKIMRCDQLAPAVPSDAPDHGLRPRLSGGGFVHQAASCDRFSRIARLSTRCSVASARGTSPTIRPAAITRIRSERPINSGSSEEMTRSAMPLAASSAIRR